MTERCVACGKPIVLVNVDKMRGVIGLTHGWVHASPLRRWMHQPIPPEYLRDEVRR